MATRLYTNNAAASLLSAITSGQTGLTVGSGQGALFPVLAGGNYATLTVASGSTVEIIKATARSTDYFTIQRGREGTAPVAFPAGSAVELRATAASFNLSGLVNATLPAQPYVVGDIPVANNTTGFVTLADVADGKVLKSGGVGAAPTYDKVRLSGATNDVTGILRVPKGGTSLSTYAVGAMVYASGTTTLAKRPIGSTGQVLKVAGGVPVWAGQGTGLYSTELVVKTTQEVVNSSTVLQDDNELKATLAASNEAIFRAWIRHTGNATADFKFSFTVPTGCTLVWNTEPGTIYSTADAVGISPEVTTSDSSKTAGGATTGRHLILAGYVHNGTTAGLLQFRWAQATSNAVTTIVGASSYLMLFRTNS